VLFPLIDLDGSVVAVQGRALYDYKALKRPKYWHSDFEKSEYLYGLRENLGLITRKGVCYLVEGPLDVITLWMAGIPAVCAFGTTLSRIQAMMLATVCDSVVVAYDFDKAGDDACDRAVPLLREFPMNIYLVAPVEGYKDVNDVWVAEGFEGTLRVYSDILEVSD
jgi:DNA primase